MGLSILESLLSAAVSRLRKLFAEALAQNNPDAVVHLAPYIFTCAVCSLSLKEIYHDLVADGLRDGNDSPKRNVLPAQAWFFPDCVHIVCSRHLPGGGMSFYQAGQKPSAVCPVCNRSSIKIAYPIYSTAVGEYDSRIPTEYFRSPELDNTRKEQGYNILRFQYENLLRFASNIVKKSESSKQVEMKTPTKNSVAAESNRSTVHKELSPSERFSSQLEHQSTSFETTCSLKYPEPGTKPYPRKPFSQPPIAFPIKSNTHKGQVHINLRSLDPPSAFHEAVPIPRHIQHRSHSKMCHGEVWSQINATNNDVSSGSFGNAISLQTEEVLFPNHSSISESPKTNIPFSMTPNQSKRKQTFEINDYDDAYISSRVFFKRPEFLSDIPASCGFIRPKKQITHHQGKNMKDIGNAKDISDVRF